MPRIWLIRSLNTVCTTKVSFETNSHRKLCNIYCSHIKATRVSSERLIWDCLVAIRGFWAVVLSDLDLLTLQWLSHSCHICKLVYNTHLTMLLWEWDDTQTHTQTQYVQYVCVHVVFSVWCVLSIHLFLDLYRYLHTHYLSLSEVFYLPFIVTFSSIPLRLWMVLYLAHRLHHRKSTLPYQSD